MENITRYLDGVIAPEFLQLLQDIGSTARKRGESAYLVGGAVRDTLLGKDIMDLDLAVEGKAISLAKQIAGELKFTVKPHPRFGTATIFKDDFRIDLVTARSETYDRPGALPTIRHGTIQDDLARRDFTINSIAVSLKPGAFGELIDPYLGHSDLKNKLVRVLHPKSFMDDPTRILRALRYQQRLDFEFEQHTLKLLRANLGCLQTVSGERLWHEVELILNEDRPEKVFSQVEELGLAAQLCGQMGVADWLEDKFGRIRKMDNRLMNLPKIYLAILMFRATDSEAATCLKHLKMAGWANRVVRETKKLATHIPSLDNPDLHPSQVYQILNGYIPEVLRAAGVASDSAVIQKYIKLYLLDLINIKPELNGHDLRNMGITSGRKIGQILKKLRDARLDNIVKSRQDEEDMVYRLLQ